METALGTPADPAQAGARLKYSKSSAFYLNTKKDFFTTNDDLLHKALEQNRLYTAQPPRLACKLCQAVLPDATDFHSHGVDYVFCTACTHLNGRHDDSEAFYAKLYTHEGGVEFNSRSYIDEAFHQRTLDVYLPKVDFLISALPPAASHRILDVGCGGGYFVHAARLRKLAATGLDVSKTSVEFGNRQLSRLIDATPLSLADEQGFFDAIVDTDADVVSLIGVIEHLRQPQRFFDAFQRSRARYLYYSVPMFSFSVILENIFKDVFPRQLSVDHTHLFTEASLVKMHALLGVKSIAEWRFGTDAMDLYRHALTRLQQNQSSPALMHHLNAGFGNSIDDFQAIFDRNHFCSEIHCVAEKSSA